MLDEFAVILERTVRELNGEIWIDLQLELLEAKQVMSSRSFGECISTIIGMREAVHSMPARELSVCVGRAFMPTVFTSLLKTVCTILLNFIRATAP